jgi:polar amino acid transport system permease protein
MTAEIILTIVRGARWTLALTITSLAFGVLVGALLCAMRVSGSKLLNAMAVVLILTFRSVPPIVWLFLIFFGVGSSLVQIGPFLAASIGLALITGANLGEIFRGALAAIHPGQWEAVHALGIPPIAAFLDVIGPQLIRVALPSVATYSIGLLKDSAVASVIGVQDLAFEASHVSQRTFRGLEVFAVAGAVYILISLPIAWAARVIDLHLRSKVAT